MLAEKDQAGNWIDYVYAGSQKIARLSVNDPRLEVQGNAGSGSKWQWYDPGMLHGYTIRAGDKLSWRQFQSPTARGGIAIVTSTNGSSTWSIAGQNGNMSNSDPVTGTWDNRVIDLTPLAGGAITLMGVGLDQNTTGAATADFADISLVSTDGTVGQVFDGNPLTLSA